MTTPARTPRIRPPATASALAGYAQVGMATAIMGSTVVVGKVAVAGLPVFLTSWLRLTLAMPVLVGIVLWTDRAGPRLRWQDYRWPFLEALSGVVLGSVLMLTGVRYTSAADAGVILATVPAAGALLALLLLDERMGRLGWTGVSLAVAGIGILTLTNTESGAHAPNRVLGNLFVLGAVCAEGLSVIVGKLAVTTLSARRVSMLVVAFGWALLAPVALMQTRHAAVGAVDARVWIAILYYGLVGSVGGSLLWFSGLRRIPASTAAVFMGVPPVSALLLSALILGEPIGWSHLAGVACVLLALACVHRDERHRA